MQFYTLLLWDAVSNIKHFCLYLTQSSTLLCLQQDKKDRGEPVLRSWVGNGRAAISGWGF
jgi:hypothetical protein